MYTYCMYTYNMYAYTLLFLSSFFCCTFQTHNGRISRQVSTLSSATRYMCTCMCTLLSLFYYLPRTFPTCIHLAPLSQAKSDKNI